LLDDPDAAVRGVQRRFHEACILGIQQSDNRTADEAIASQNETLAINNTLNFVVNNTAQTSQLSAASNEILQSVTTNLCPGETECSGNGTCNNGVCVCDPGIVSVVLHG
jgi:EGF-like domain